MEIVSARKRLAAQRARPASDSPGARFRYVIPDLPDGFVPRPRVTRLLEEGGSSARVTLVSAPAGTGKTTAVAAWARQGRTPWPVVWVSLDDVRAVGASLWDTVLDALQQSPATREVLDGWETAVGSSRFLASLTAALIELTHPVVLVLDRVEDLTRDDAADLDLVSRHSGGNLRLVLISRADPPFPFHRYRVSDGLVEIRMADLAFTRKEAVALLAARGAVLSHRSAQVLIERTDGWAVGLVLATMLLGEDGTAEPDLARLCGDNGIVSEYLLAEVLDRHTPAARELLLRSSVVDVLEPGLAEAIGGPNAVRSLRFLERGNAFLEVIPHSGGRMRIQPLFRELLRAQFAYERPGERAELHLQAAQWLARDGQLDAAVTHASRAGRAELAAAWLLELTGLGQLMLAPPTSSLWQAVDDEVLPLLVQVPELPDSVPSGAAAAVELLRAARAITHDHLEAATAHLNAARHCLTETPDPKLAPALDLLAAELVTRDDTDQAALAAARSITDLVRAHDVGGPLPAAAAMATAAGHLGLGDLPAAREAYLTAEQLIDAGAATPLTEGLRCRGWAARALIAAWTGHLRQARELAEQLRARRTESAEGSAEQRAARLSLAWVHVETMDLDEVGNELRHMSRCRLPTAAAERSLHLAMTGLVRARLAYVAGQRQRARDALRLAEDQLADGPGWLVDRLGAERNWLRLAPGAASAPPGQGNDVTATVERRIIEAAARRAEGQHATARRALERALRTASQEQMRRPFMFAGPGVRAMLTDETPPAARAWLSVPLGPVAQAPAVGGPESSGGGWPGSSAPLLLTPLTDKEHEVLTRLAQLLSTDEIAAGMFVSVNTVRTHVRSILRKLGASRRNDAVRRARELGLI